MDLMHEIAPVHAPMFDPRVAESISRQTTAPLELASRVYREELDTLASKARITRFLHVIASRRARLRLRRHSVARTSMGTRLRWARCGTQ
jgi:hypothetical protein